MQLVVSRPLAAVAVAREQTPVNGENKDGIVATPVQFIIAFFIQIKRCGFRAPSERIITKIPWSAQTFQTRLHACFR
jgi:hypothetical protein